MRESTSRIWLEGAIAAAFAMALSFIPLKFGPGFSVSIGMIPVIVYSFRRGTSAGIYSGLVWGLLHFLLGKAYILTVSQALIEYLLAYTFVGLAGLYAKPIKEKIEAGQTPWLQLLIGVLIGTVARYIWHYLAGVIFWGKYALWGLSPSGYSLVINGTSGVMTGIATYLVILLLVKKSPQLLIPK